MKRASFIDWEYWARPVPGFGDPAARLLVVGLAPAAHGGNRTGRMFTGDRSGDWLFGALYRAGYANQAESTSRDDGLELHGAYVTAAVRCAPPANKPTTAERDQCLPFLLREFNLLTQVKVVVALGSYAWDAVLRTLVAAPLKPKPKFGHLAEVEVPIDPDSTSRQSITLIGSYHPSQQNTFTGKLTPDMFDAVFERASRLIGETR